MFQAITGMKDAVDKQELKIQKNLVNAEEPLMNITNRQGKRSNLQEKSTRTKIECDLEGIIEEESENHDKNSHYSELQHEYPSQVDDDRLLDEIWGWEDEDHRKHNASWFKHWVDPAYIDSLL